MFVEIIKSLKTFFLGMEYKFNVAASLEWVSNYLQKITLSVESLLPLKRSLLSADQLQRNMSSNS